MQDARNTGMGHKLQWCSGMSHVVYVGGACHVV